MKVVARKRKIGELYHHDLCLVAEDEQESKVLDLLGQPGTTFSGEVRLADGYGEHYLLIQPKHQIGVGGWTRDFDGAATGGAAVPR